MKKLLTENQKRIVFYDGECGLCSRSIQIILKNHTKDFYFISLQSSLAEEIMDQHHNTINMNTLYLLEEGKLYDKSTAALRIFRNLKFPFNFISPLRFIIPKLLRDKVYLLVAKRRFDFYPSACIIPSEKEKEFFLK